MIVVENRLDIRTRWHADIVYADRKRSASRIRNGDDVLENFKGLPGIRRDELLLELDRPRFALGR